MAASLSGVVTKFYDEYANNTPKKLKIIDAYLVYVFFTGVFQVSRRENTGTVLFDTFIQKFIYFLQKAKTILKKLLPKGENTHIMLEKSSIFCQKKISSSIIKFFKMIHSSKIF